MLGAADLTWLFIVTGIKENRELTTSHSRSKRIVVDLDIVNFQHMHEELRQKSA